MLDENTLILIIASRVFNRIEVRATHNSEKQTSLAPCLYGACLVEGLRKTGTNNGPYFCYKFKSEHIQYINLFVS